jgi:hypothetical protein
MRMKIAVTCYIKPYITVEKCQCFREIDICPALKRLNSEDGGSRCLWNFGPYIPHHTVSHEFDFQGKTDEEEKPPRNFSACATIFARKTNFKCTKQEHSGLLR